MSFNRKPKAGRFSEAGQSGVESGYQKSSQGRDPLDNKFVRRNIKPFKTLKKFSQKGGLKGLKKQNTEQLENKAAKAVITKKKIKSAPLNTKINKNRYKPKAIKRAKKRLGKIDQSFKPGSTRAIKNKRVRRAANHLRELARNRRVNKTKVGSKKAYGIWKGTRRN